MNLFSASAEKRIIEILVGDFAPMHLDVRDDSAAHAGHEGAKRHGGGHYTITIVAEQFCNCSRVARHRAIYRALDAEFRSTIHALAIAAYTPAEWQRLQEDNRHA